MFTWRSVLTALFCVFCLQRWQKSGTHLEHLVSRFCLDSEMALDGMDSSRMLVISPCELSAYTQRWEVPFSWPLTPDPVTPCPVAPSQPQRPGQRQLLWQGEDAWARQVEELLNAVRRGKKSGVDRNISKEGSSHEVCIFWGCWVEPSAP